MADCSIAGDQSKGFVTTLNGKVYSIDLQTLNISSGTNPIPISNKGEDTSLSANQKYLLVTGDDVEPVSVVDINNQSEVTALAVSDDYISSEVCSNGSVLLSSSSGKVHRFMMSESGSLTDTGEEFDAGSSVNNVICSPDGNSGIAILRFPGTIKSFIVSGMTPVDIRSLSGHQGISGSFTKDGTKVFIRSNIGFIDAFTFNSATGSLGASPENTIISSFASPLFGVEQIALHPDGSKLYASKFDWTVSPMEHKVDVFDTNTGALISQLDDGNLLFPAGICFPGEATIVEGEVLEKTLTHGPDEDTDGIPDVVIPINQSVTTKYQWTITYNNPEGPENVIIKDKLTPVWLITEINENGSGLPLDCGVKVAMDNGSGLVKARRGGQEGKKCQSASHLTWEPNTGSSPQSISVDVETRRSASGKAKYKPNHCGPFYLNKGVKAYDMDNPGDPIAESNKLCVAAVKNPGSNRGSTADNDGDGIPDFQEACLNPVQTNPCSADTDNDGVEDGEDNCPDVYNPSQDDEDNNGLGDQCQDD
jgi:hypothetical protein